MLHTHTLPQQDGRNEIENEMDMTMKLQPTYSEHKTGNAKEDGKKGSTPIPTQLVSNNWCTHNPMHNPLIRLNSQCVDSTLLTA